MATTLSPGHNMQKLDDMSLVAQVVVAGNRRAFDRLVVKYQSSIRRFFITQTLGDGQLSDDLAQDTFLKAYTHLSMFRGAAGFKTWLFRIAYNVFYDHVRNSRPTSSLDAVAETSVRTADGGGSLSVDMQRALSVLTANERTCVILQVMEGQPIDEIAAITGMPEGTVKSHLSRGKHKLATFLRNNGYDR